MVRPEKFYRFKRNADSLQFFEDGVYCGTLPLRVLCRMAKEKTRPRHNGIKAQTGGVEEQSEAASVGTSFKTNS